MNQNMLQTDSTARLRLTRNEIESLVNMFSEKTLPHSMWTHAAHLIVGLWCAKNLTHEQAVHFLRTNIKGYNETVGVVNGRSSGYHETITLFWLWLVENFVQHHPGDSIEQLCSNLLGSKYGDRNLALKFYSKEQLFSTRARYTWLPPDLQDLNYSYI